MLLSSSSVLGDEEAVVVTVCWVAVDVEVEDAVEEAELDEDTLDV